jgi:uncharacterized protein (UPF0332 family)
MSSDLDDLILYRLSRARETLEEAHILADANHRNACVNRLYYACFYAVLALLIQKELTTSKHSGVRSLFNFHFVKTGKIPKEIARTYSDLFERQEGDYDDFVTFESADVRTWIADTELFVRAIEELIQRNKK